MSRVDPDEVFSRSQGAAAASARSAGTPVLPAARTAPPVERGATVPALLPRPASLRFGHGEGFTVTAGTTVVVRPGSPAAVAVGDHLAGLLRPATGHPLPVTVAAAPATDGGIVLDHTAPASDGGIVLDHTGPARLGAEGYRLEVSRSAVRLTGHRPEGLFRGVQTLRQLLPPEVESATVQPGPWPVPEVTVEDRPRFPYRGVMLDVSRHFFGVAEVKRYLDLAAMYKINVLHLHLSDDQGWRIMIETWPRLARYGGGSQVGGGAGGHYTAEEYAEIVAYAAARHVTVIPEIDSPGHCHAALAAYPELNRDGVAPPRYTGTEVGFSSLCTDRDLTYAFLDDVWRELAAITPGPYLHLGGDEAHATPRGAYQEFLSRAFPIIGRYGKRVVGWQEIAAGPLPPGALVQYWGTGDARSARLIRLAVRKGARVVMSPANHAYLDMKYDPASPYGQDWAGCLPVRQTYGWDPARLVRGVREAHIAGVEAPLWTETVADVSVLEYMTYPRLPGIAEAGWSTGPADDWDTYRARLAAQGRRWDVLGVSYHRAPDVPWS